MFQRENELLIRLPVPLFSCQTGVLMAEVVSETKLIYFHRPSHFLASGRQLIVSADLRSELLSCHDQ